MNGIVHYQPGTTITEGVPVAAQERCNMVHLGDLLASVSLLHLEHPA
jgi:hypothetical protein